MTNLDAVFKLFILTVAGLFLFWGALFVVWDYARLRTIEGINKDREVKELCRASK
jgi:hypothetical protein